MKISRTIVVLVGVQITLIGLYLAVESRRRAPTPFAVEGLDEPAPMLSLERDGHGVVQPSEPHLVHFWATWCGPCQEELPALLAAAESEDAPLVAVTDEPWPVVERYFGDSVPMAIVRDPTGEAAGDWRVSGLPDTFVVRSGRVVGRMGGPRDWRAPEARAFLRELRRPR
jgi:thiol-disulfide isomerase/thioredoxin